jgi:uncharacterized protein (DUF1330 family)
MLSVTYTDVVSPEGLKMPKGYIVNNIDVRDEVGYANYRVTAAKVLQDAGGTFLVRGGRHEVIEGHSYGRIIICEFESYEAAHAASEAVRALDLRGDSAIADIVVVEGV